MLAEQAAGLLVKAAPEEYLLELLILLRIADLPR
jgi:hypothetical protein